MKDTSALEKAEEVEEEEGEQQQAMHRDKHRTNGLNATAQCRNVRKGKASQVCKKRRPGEYKGKSREENGRFLLD